MTLGGILQANSDAAPSTTQWWASGPFVIVLAILTVLSLLVTIWALTMAYRPRPVQRKIRYRVESVPLVDSRLHGTGVTVTDDTGVSLERVTATTVDIVNSGRSTLVNTDIRSGRRGFPSCLVLDVSAGSPLKVVRAEIDDDHRAHVDPAIREVAIDGETFWAIDFNVLSPGDGFRVAFLHDGAEIEHLELIGFLPDGDVIHDSPTGRADFFSLVASEVAEVSFALPLFGSVRFKRREPADPSRWSR